MTAAVHGRYAQRVAHRGRVRVRGWALPVVVAVVASAAPAGAAIPVKTWSTGNGLASSPDSSVLFSALGTHLLATPVAPTAASYDVDTGGSGDVANDGDILRFHLPDWASLPPLRGHGSPVSEIALSKDGTRLAATGAATVRLHCTD